MEHVIYSQTMDHLEQHDILSKLQHGYQHVYSIYPAMSHWPIRPRIRKPISSRLYKPWFCLHIWCCATPETAVENEPLWYTKYSTMDTTLHHGQNTTIIGWRCNIEGNSNDFGNRSRYGLGGTVFFAFHQRPAKLRPGLFLWYLLRRYIDRQGNII